LVVGGGFSPHVKKYAAHDAAQKSEDSNMSKLLTSALLGAGMLVALAATASAQSVANLPPGDTAAPPPPAAGAPVASSMKGIQADPGSLGAPKSDGKSADVHPYTSQGTGPKPN
jgi:hypothetical protein